MTEPSEAREVLNQWASIGRRMMSNSGAIVGKSAEKVGTGSFTTQDWIKVATQMFDVALLGGIELVETALAGSPRFAPQLIRSDPVTLAAAPQTDRRLSIAVPFARLGDLDPIPGDRLSFDIMAGRDVDRNPLGTLHAETQEFYVLVDTDDLSSGVYRGEVRVAKPDGSEEFITSVTIPL